VKFMQRGILLTAFVFAVSAAAPGLAQTATQPTTLGDSAKALIGAWEFSNADHDKICSATFKSDATKLGFKVEFEKKCTELFPVVSDVAAWTFPDNDLLRFVDSQGKVLVEFSEVEDGIYEAPTPGLGVLFLQKPGAGSQAKPAEQVAGDWAITRRGGPPICTLTLAATAVKDGFALSVKPGCDPAIARLNFTQWKLDDDELLLIPARGTPWRFEDDDNNGWRRVPPGTDQYALARQ
jgi:Protease inhibitor Inh